MKADPRIQAALRAATLAFVSIPLGLSALPASAADARVNKGTKARTRVRDRKGASGLKGRVMKPGLRQPNDKLKGRVLKGRVLKGRLGKKKNGKKAGVRKGQEAVGLRWQGDTVKRRVLTPQLKKRIQQDSALDARVLKRQQPQLKSRVPQNAAGKAKKK